MPTYGRALPSLQFKDRRGWDSDPESVDEEGIDPWTLDRTATSSGTSTPELVPDEGEPAGERLFFDCEPGRLFIINQLLRDASPETLEAVSATLGSHGSRDSDSQESLGGSTRSFGSHLTAMESFQALTQQVHPDGQTFYRCRVYTLDAMEKLLKYHDLETGDVQHPRPHDWLIVPTWFKVTQLRGEGSEKEVTDRNRDFRAKFDHGVNKLMVQLQAARKGEACACQRWYTYPELEDLTGLKVVCEVGRYVPSLLLYQAIIITPKHLYSQVQIDAIVFKCLAHFYDDKAKELPSRIGGILSCTELKERNKHLYGHPA